MRVSETAVSREENTHPRLLPKGVDDDEAFKAHSAVEVQTIGFQEFSPSPECVVEVRRFVRAVLEPRGLNPDCIFECQLVADELATNAVTHAGSIFSVAIELTDAFVRVAVRDDADALPIPQASSSEAVSGRGLSIVLGTACGWGTVALGIGKETWADVSSSAR
jgi:anti-sigma regulatory factor (Ser/Thr protein kinase)